MKRKLQVGDIIEVKAKDRRYSSTDYKIEITEITVYMAKGRELDSLGTISRFSTINCFNLYYDDTDYIAHVYGTDKFNCWDRKVIPLNMQ